LRTNKKVPKSQRSDLRKEYADNSDGPQKPARDSDTANAGPRRGVPDAPQGEVERLQIPIDQGSVFLGKRGSGKTEGVKFEAEELPYDMIILDVVGNLKELADKLEKQKRKVEYHLVNPHDNATISAVLQKAMKQGDKMVLMDEADRYEYYANKKNTITDFINLSRNYRCGYMATARRTANISPDFLSNATYVFVFKHTHPRDLKVLSEWFDMDPQEFRSLKPHQFILFIEGDPAFKGVFEIDLPKKPANEGKKAPPELEGQTDDENGGWG
jgi:hypothetical protein